jgi:hypothetical protein
VINPGVVGESEEAREWREWREGRGMSEGTSVKEPERRSQSEESRVRVVRVEREGKRYK